MWRFQALFRPLSCLWGYPKGYIMAEQAVKTQGTSFILVARYAKQTSQELHEKNRSPVDGTNE
jgi:hypothetical protein